MSIGTMIRYRLGGLEIPAAELYRSVFIDLDDLATKLATLAEPRRILEIGCGDGACAQRLAALYPDAEYLGIDIAPSPGRLYRGDPEWAAFRSMSTSDLVAEKPEPFDLVLFVDVVHHVPVDLRRTVLEDAAALTAPDGTIAVKDWEKDSGFAHRLVYVADRYITGDRNVSFATDAELREILAGGLPGFETFFETRISPRRNNVLYGLRRPRTSPEA